jgi:hypothetical protein
MSGRTAVESLELALGFTVVLDANGAASAGRVGGHCGNLVWVGIEGWELVVVWRFKGGINKFS